MTQATSAAHRHPVQHTHWFALSTRSRAEKAARDYLDAHAVETFLPTFIKGDRFVKFLARRMKEAMFHFLIAGVSSSGFNPVLCFCSVVSAGSPFYSRTALSDRPGFPTCLHRNFYWSNLSAI